MAIELQRETTEYLFFAFDADTPSGAKEVAFAVPPARPDTWHEFEFIEDDQHALWGKAVAAVGPGHDFYGAILVGDFGGNPLVLAPEDDPGHQGYTRLTNTPTRPVRRLPVGVIVR